MSLLGQKEVGEHRADYRRCVKSNRLELLKISSAQNSPISLCKKHYTDIRQAENNSCTQIHGVCIGVSSPISKPKSENIRHLEHHQIQKNKVPVLQPAVSAFVIHRFPPASSSAAIYRLYTTVNVPDPGTVTQTVLAAVLI